MNPIKMILLVIVIAAAVSACSVPGSEKPAAGMDGSEKPALAIDGTIVFASPHEGGQYADIFLLDAQGTHWLTGAANTMQSNPVWSPDGTQIAYITDKWQLAVFQRDGSGGAYLTPESDDPALWAHGPAWLPDGNISIAVGGKLAILRPDGSGMRVLTPTPSFPSFSGAYAWSPDGSQIVFDCTSDLLSTPRVCLFDVESDESRTLLEPAWRFQAFAWSPDGRKIVAGDWSGGNQGPSESAEDLYVFDADGQNLQALAQPGQEGNPAWSPDGKMIVYQSYNEGSEGSSLDLWVMNADGSGAQKLVSGDYQTQPDWTPH